MSMINVEYNAMNAICDIAKIKKNDPDYWTRLEHQYAGMAMQGMLNNSLLIASLLKVNTSHEDIVAEVTDTAIRYAHALVEKMKNQSV